LEGRSNRSIYEESVTAAKALDGCYVIKTTVTADALAKDQVFSRNKNLSRVEQVFRNMKTASLEIIETLNSQRRNQVGVCVVF